MTSATVTEVLLTGESMMSFAPNLMKEERDDLFDLLMQADGFASRAFDRQQLWKSWMDRYRNRLEKHGCRPVSLITEPAQVVTSADQMQACIASITGRVATPLLARQVETTLKWVRDSQYAERFFRAGEQEEGFSSFLSVPSEKTASGDILLVVLGVNVTLSVETRDFDFWTSTRRDMVLRVVGGVYRFDRQVYDGYRQAIRADLRERALAQVVRIELER
ncbi:hypothetical protein [Pseudomonas sp. 2835]|uniref:hypothetical protein n=1 Tax=Pseudomonas sp. 2835 TaxID=3156451 RepID=UPI003D1DA44C